MDLPLMQKGCIDMFCIRMRIKSALAPTSALSCAERRRSYVVFNPCKVKFEFRRCLSSNCSMPFV